MFRAFNSWLKNVGQWVRKQNFDAGDELMSFCCLFLLTSIMITVIITLAWYTTVGKILVGVLLVMFLIFINCKYSD